MDLRHSSTNSQTVVADRVVRSISVSSFCTFSAIITRASSIGICVKRLLTSKLTKRSQLHNSGTTQHRVQ